MNSRQMTAKKITDLSTKAIVKSQITLFDLAEPRLKWALHLMKNFYRMLKKYGPRESLSYILKAMACAIEGENGTAIHFEIEVDVLCKISSGTQGHEIVIPISKDELCQALGTALDAKAKEVIKDYAAMEMADLYARLYVQDNH
jgi:hypothetical protein